jgi:hypothetical protein
LSTPRDTAEADRSANRSGADSGLLSYLWDVQPAQTGLGSGVDAVRTSICAGVNCDATDFGNLMLLAIPYFFIAGRSQATSLAPLVEFRSVIAVVHPGT